MQRAMVCWTMVVSSLVNANCVLDYPVVTTIDGPDLAVSSLAWNPNNTFLVGAMYAGNVTFWNSSLQQQSSYAILNVRTVLWSPQGDLLATIFDNSNDFSLNSVNNFSLVFTFSHAGVQCLAWSPDGHQIASGSLNGSVAIWNIVTKQMLYSFVSSPMYENAEVYSLAWSKGRIALGLGDGSINIWDVDKQVLQLRFAQPRAQKITQVAWRFDGRLLASVSLGNLTFWETLNGSISAVADVSTFPLGRDVQLWEIRNIAWEPQGFLLAAAHDDYFTIWDSFSGKNVFLETTGEEVAGSLPSAVAWNSQNGLLTGGFSVGESSIIIFDTALGAKTQVLEETNSSPSTLVWSPTGDRIACGVRDTVQVWDAVVGVTLHSFSSNATITDLSWHPDGNLLMSATAKDLVIWNVTTNKLFYNISNSPAKIAQWSVDGYLFAFISNTDTMTVWNFTSNTLLVSRDGSLLAWSRDNYLAYLVRTESAVYVALANGTKLATFYPHNPPSTLLVRALAWNSKGTQLAVAYNNGVDIWDMFSNQTKRLQAIGVVWKLSWNSNDLLLITEDTKVYVWDATPAGFSRNFSFYAFASVWHPFQPRFVVSTETSIMLVDFFGPPKLSVSQIDNTVMFQISGHFVDTTTAWIQLSSDIRECVFLDLSPSLQMNIPNFPPGLYRMQIHDKYRENENPWFEVQLYEVSCAPGYQENKIGECEECPPNTFDSFYSVTGCLPCAGIVINNRTDCKDCDTIAYRPQNSSDCVCPTGYYGLTEEDPHACRDCPEYAYCHDGTIDALTGYYQTLDNKTYFLPCPNKACIDGECAFGYHGALCAECDVGYGQQAHTCVECGDFVLLVMVAVGLSIGVLCLCAVLSWLSLRSDPTKPNIAASAFKVGLSAAQINAMLLRVNVPVPTWIANMLLLLDGVQGPSSTVFSLSCLLLKLDYKPSSIFYIQSTLIFLTPLALLGCMKVSVMLAQRYMIHKQGVSKEDAQVQLRRWFVTGVTAVWFVFHPTLVLQAFQLFACESVNYSRTDYRLISDVAVKCFDAQHFLFIAVVGIPMLLLYGILPLVFALYYIKQVPKDRIFDPQVNELMALCNDYKPEHAWWFFVVAFRKIAGTLIVSFFTDISLQLVLMLQTLCFFWVSTVAVRPYASVLKKVSWAESASLFVSVSLFSFASLALNDKKGLYSNFIGNIVVILVAMFYVALGCLMVSDVCQRYNRKSTSDSLYMPLNRGTICS